ncbi:plasmid stabilization protein [Rhizobium deserti]|uniref:Plasmid stabilization protein n=1 Tax=Rhizobium deserti TaxID=2547961 RepID=A0A4R5UJX7_9HYPH|nr:plasmid stabilization protein [Rhizobium deserti]TDK37063.1 plasmid stabilization protein [Rhizobium deserti]
MMNAITIRNLSDEASRALEARAAEHGTTAEVEAQHILQDALTVAEAGKAGGQKTKPTVGLGTALRQLRDQYPELEDIDFSRDQTLARGPSFE